MQRRSFIKTSATTLASSILYAKQSFVPLQGNRKKPIKPLALKKGAKVCIIAPGSGLDSKDIDKALQNINSLGFEPELSKNATGRNGYLSATDDKRLLDLHDAFENDNYDAIWCLRGGYGTARLLPMIDYTLIKKNPKIFIGYSDITALLNTIYTQTGLITFHGPVASSTFTPFTTKHVLDVLTADSKNYMLTSYNPIYLIDDKLDLSKNKGSIKGILMGGNLSILASLCGTSYGLNPKNVLLFLEEIGEKPYRIDRMMTQLRQGNILNKVNGCLLGQFKDCDSSDKITSHSLDFTLRHQCIQAQVKTLCNLPFGHIEDTWTLPIGIMAEFDLESYTIQLLESSTSSV